MEEGSPKNKEPQIKVVNGKTFSWCPHHKAWCPHKPSEFCLGMPVTNVDLSGTSMETRKIQVRYVRRKRIPRIMSWNTRIKASYPIQMGQNLAQS